MASGIISFDPVTQGSAYLAALAAARIFATRRSDGLFVSDTIAAAAVSTAAIVAEAQTIRSAEVDQIVAGKIAAGFAYGEKTIEIDPASQANITAQTLVAVNSAASPATYPWPSGFFWICADGSHLALSTAPAMIAMGAAVGVYVSGLIVNAAGLKAQIMTADSVSAVQVIDLTAGWPT